MKIKILIALFLCIASASLLGAQETASGLELLTDHGDGAHPFRGHLDG